MNSHYKIDSILRGSKGRRYLLKAETKSNVSWIDFAYKDLKQDEQGRFRFQWGFSEVILPSNLEMKVADETKDLVLFKDTYNLGYDLYITKEVNEFITLTPVEHYKDESRKESAQSGVMVFKNVPNRKKIIPRRKFYQTRK